MVYLSYLAWKQSGYPTPSASSVFCEDTNVLMHLLGVFITAVLGAKLLPYDKSKRISDLHFILCITETGVWLKHYASGGLPFFSFDGLGS
jgi:hypothetical protein